MLTIWIIDRNRLNFITFESDQPFNTYIFHLAILLARRRKSRLTRVVFLYQLYWHKSVVNVWFWWWFKNIVILYTRIDLCLFLREKDELMKDRNGTLKKNFRWMTNPSRVFQEKRVYHGVEQADKWIFSVINPFEGSSFTGNSVQCRTNRVLFWKIPMNRYQW